MNQSRAAVLLAPRSIETREFVLPEIAGDDALLRIEASGICGTDRGWYTGELRKSRVHPEGLPFPFILGHEPVGRIASIGDQARARWGVDVGDRVAVHSGFTCGRCEQCRNGEGAAACAKRGVFGVTGIARKPSLWGSYAEFMYLPPGAVINPIDPSVSAAVATLFNPLGAGYAWAVEAPALRPGATIAVLGPGQRGLACIVAARDASAGRIIVIGRNPLKLELATVLGADHVIDSNESDPVRSVMALTGSVGADVVVDITPKSLEATAQALKMVRTGGTVVLAGQKGSRPLIGVIADELINKRITLKGVSGVGMSAFRRACAAISSRRFPLEQMHTHDFPIEAAAQALETLAAPNSGAIHVAIVPHE